ncbi:DNA topology modulation protein [Ralstonia pickettii]|nr:DNA topology modulation protein [Ralstonia pickettii]
MKKIAIIGSGGAGKSTFARQLSAKLNIKVYHLDAILWKPNWIGTPKDEQKRIQHDLIANESWIIDGNYGSTLDIRLNAADTIIFLDIHRLICLYRAVKRTFQYRNRTRPDMAEGCEERFDRNFLKWIWNYPHTRRPATINKLEELSTDKKVIILHSPKEVKRFIANLEGE